MTQSILRTVLYRWGPEFSVYVKGLDRQHMYLVTTLNNLYRFLLSGQPRKVMDRTLDALSEYTRFHFRSEELLFDKYGYPRAEQHRREHRGFVDKVTEFMEKYRANEEKLTIDVLHFLASWVRSHILGSDHDYAEWFYERDLPFVDNDLVWKSRKARIEKGIERKGG